MFAKRMLFTILAAGIILLAGSANPGNAGLETPQNTNANSALYSYRMSGEFQLSTDVNSEKYQPDVAYNYNHHESLVVWHNTWPGGSRDIYARRVSDSGEVLSWFCVTTGVTNRSQPAVAYNGTTDEYLIVWMQEVGSNIYEIWGRIIPWNAPGTNADFQIIGWANRSFWSPRVAWNNNLNEYMVAWNAFDTTTSFPPGTPNDIAGYRVSYSGVVQNAGSPLIFTYSDSPHQMDMNFNVTLNEYFLVFVVVHTQVTTGNDIYGLRVSWNGAPVNPPGLIHICDLAKDQNTPAVATNGEDRYLVVWDHAYSSIDHDIYGREYYALGTPVGSYFTIASWTENTTAPAIAVHGENLEWLAVWQQELSGGTGYAIKGFRWGSNATIWTYFFDVANYAFWENENPAVSATASGFLIVYEGDSSTTYRHIFGRMWWGESQYLPLLLRN